MGASFLAFGREMLVLAFVIGLLVLLARVARRWQGGVRTSDRTVARIDVLARRSLGKHASLQVVQVGGRTFLVGQSVQQMTLLAELDGSQWTTSSKVTSTSGPKNQQFLTPGTAMGPGENSPGAWDAFIDRLREMTVRH